MAFVASYLVLLACCVFLRAAWSAAGKRKAPPRTRPRLLMLTGPEAAGAAPGVRTQPPPAALALTATAARTGYDRWSWGHAAEGPRAAPAVLTSFFVLLDLSQAPHPAAASPVFSFQDSLDPASETWRPEAYFGLEPHSAPFVEMGGAVGLPGWDLGGPEHYAHGMAAVTSYDGWIM
jgi:hypothetical protein